MTGRSTTFVAAVLLGGAVARAQTDSHLLLDDWADNKHFEADSAAAVFPRSRIGDGESTRFVRAYSEGRFRLDPSMPLSPSVGYSWTHIGLSSGTRLPGELDDLSLGIGSPLFSQGPWFGGGSFGVGYAGDDAFAADHAWYANATAFVGYQIDTGKTLIFALDYKGNRSLLPDVPIPSVEYDWKVSPKLEVAAGFPTSAVEWRPTPQLTLSAEYDFPLTVVAEAKYQLAPPLAVSLRFVSDDDPFHVDALGDDRRIFYQDNRIELGLIGTPAEGVDLRAGVGYGFDRKFVTGFDDRDTDTVADLQDQAYVRLGVDLKF